EENYTAFFPSFCLLCVLCASVVNLRRSFVMRCVLALLAVLVPALVRADEPVPKPVNDKIKEVAGSAEYLRSVPKFFATLQAVDAANRRVTLLIEGEKL